MMNRTKLAAEQAKWAAAVVRVEMWYTLVRERLQYCKNLRMLRELHWNVILVFELGRLHKKHAVQSKFLYKLSFCSRTKETFRHTT